MPNPQILTLVGSLSPPGGILYFIACKYYLLHYLILVEESNITLITSVLYDLRLPKGYFNVISLTELFHLQFNISVPSIKL